MKNKVAILGIGYVGLQSALSFSEAGMPVIAFDINEQRIHDLAMGVDGNQEIANISSDNLLFTSDPAQLKDANYYLISVPTPINEHKIPDIYALKSVSKLVALVLKKGDVVVLESTVFPGATRELLIPILQEKSGLVSGEDFFVGYSSERITPGDEQHSLIKNTKVISGQNKEALDKIEALYQTISGLKLYCAPSLEVAESSKLLENIQRNVNIALMNEFAQIMNGMNISIHEVLETANTKWNFLPFTPGLVGGHCIPEDPYYLIYQADKSDSLHGLISHACQVNQQFYFYIVDMTIKLLIKQGMILLDAKVAVLGISFKANVSDTRHSLSINLYHYLKSSGINAVACDPLVDRAKVNLDWLSLDELNECHAIILCQPHRQFLEFGALKLCDKIIPKGVFIDIPGAFSHSTNFRDDVIYWGL